MSFIEDDEDEDEKEEEEDGVDEAANVAGFGAGTPRLASVAFLALIRSRTFCTSSSKTCAKADSDTVSKL
jgi:hypothetical protein